jgi:hypothetical protein
MKKASNYYSCMTMVSYINITRNTAAFSLGLTCDFCSLLSALLRLSGLREVAYNKHVHCW